MFCPKKDDIVTVRRDQYKAWCRQKATVSRVFPLPAEILSLILQHARDSQSTIYSASLVCKQWLHCAAPLLYRHPHIRDTFRWATFLLTLTRPFATFAYGNVVRSIDLSKRHLSGSQRLNEPFTFLDTPKQQLIFDEYQSLITVSTSSLLQITQTCPNITSLNLSDTFVFHDKMIVETGEYLSTLQQYAVRPGLTQIEIPIEEVVKAIGGGCRQLERLEVRQTRWITAHTIWLFAYYCPRLKQMDARRSPNCTVKKLTTQELISFSSPLVEHGFEEGSDTEDYFLGPLAADTDPETRSLNIFQVPEEIPDENPDVMNLVHIMEAESAQQDLLNEERFNQIWLAPTFTEEISSPSMHGRSLKDMIYTILVEARNTGAHDLDWLDEYQ